MTYDEKMAIILDSFVFNYTPTHTQGGSRGWVGRVYILKKIKIYIL